MAKKRVGSSDFKVKLSEKLVITTFTPAISYLHIVENFTSSRITVTDFIASAGIESVAGSPLTTKGDLFTYSTVNAKLPISGNDGWVLAEDSAEPTGLKWIALAGGGDMLLGTSQVVTALKTFEDGTFGLRNVADDQTAVFVNTNTATRTYTLPNVSGTVALTGDIPSVPPATDYWLTAGTTSLTAPAIIDVNGTDTFTIRTGTSGGRSAILLQDFASSLQTWESGGTDTFHVTTSSVGVKIGTTQSATESKIEVLAASMVITDAISSKGLVNAADYTANLTARSLIDQGHADGRYAPISITGTVTGTGTNNQVALWNGTDDIDALTAGTNTHVLTMVAGVPAWAANVDTGATQLSDLSDVTSATQTDGFVIASSGGDYIGRALVEADISNLGVYSTDIHANITALDNVGGVNTGDQDLNEQRLEATEGTYTVLDSDKDITVILTGIIDAVPIVLESATKSVGFQVTILNDTGNTSTISKGSDSTVQAGAIPDLLDGEYFYAELISTSPNTWSVLIGEAALLTTKGDIYTYDTDDQRLAVSGNDGWVLSEDSSEATGLKWIALAGGGDMLLGTIQTVTAAKTFDTATLLLNDTDSAFDLELGSTSTITSANKTLIFDVNDANRTLTISGDATITGSNTGDQTITLTGDVTGTGTGSFATTIAAKAVDVAMLADGTDGELITWDAAGVAAVVAVGTATHVLTSNGVGVAPTFQAQAGG